jgi:hypothetical protein
MDLDVRYGEVAARIEGDHRHQRTGTGSSSADQAPM